MLVDCRNDANGGWPDKRFLILGVWEMCSAWKQRETSVGPCRGPWLRFYPALLRHSSISCSAALFCQRKCASLMCCGATPICFYVCFLSWHLGSCGVENAGVHSARGACWPVYLHVFHCTSQRWIMPNFHGGVEELQNRTGWSTMDRR